MQQLIFKGPVSSSSYVQKHHLGVTLTSQRRLMCGQAGAQQHTQQRRAREQPDTTWREDDRPQVHCTDSLDGKKETK